MKRILIVSPRRIWPVNNGGALRIALVADALAALGEVRALTIDRDGMGPAVDPRETSFTCSGTGTRLWKAAISVCGTVPLQSALLWSADFQAAVRAELERTDLLVIHLSRTLPLLPPLPDGLPVLYELTDCLSANQRSLAGAKGLKNRLLSWDARNMARVERSILRQSFPGVVVTADEVAKLRALLPESEICAPLAAIPNGYDFSRAAFHAFPAQSASARRLVFIGDFFYEPNRLAAAWMARELLPLLPEEIGIDCIGRGELGALVSESHGRLRHLGYVEDLQACLSGYALAVCPIFHGGGMQNKAITPVLHGVPTLLTPMVARGLGYGQMLGVAADAAAFAQQAARLLADDELRRELYDLQCGAFRERFSREGVLEQYRALARPLLGV